MKFHESWLRTFVNPPVAVRELAHAVTMSGVEVEQVDADGDDWVLTLKPTPNRGDCLGVLGVAREVAAVTGAPLMLPDIKPVRAAITDRLAVALDAPQACPRYCGRLVKGVDPLGVWVSPVRPQELNEAWAATGNKGRVLFLTTLTLLVRLLGEFPGEDVEADRRRTEAFFAPVRGRNSR